MEKLFLVLVITLVLIENFNFCNSKNDISKARNIVKLIKKAGCNNGDRATMDKFVKCYKANKDIGDVDKFTNDCATETKFEFTKDSNKETGLKRVCLSFENNNRSSSDEGILASCVIKMRAEFLKMNFNDTAIKTTDIIKSCK